MTFGPTQKPGTITRMSDYQLSRRAASDLDAIADYTIERFGINQARQYRDELEACFQKLVENPKIGRRAEQLSPGLRRFEHQSHVIFYTRTKSQLLIVRVLHSRMDVPKQF